MSEHAAWSLAGKTCLVTGASSGIGRETALALARASAHLVLVCRDRERGERTVQSIREGSGNRTVELMLGDLSVMEEVNGLAERYRRKHDTLHVLVNNAGVLNLSRRRRVTREGFEETFAVNYLAPFLLTHRLLDILRASAPARVVNVSSVLHKRARLDTGDLQKLRRFSGVRAYCHSKLALNLFTFELARRLEGKGVSVNCLHPGGVATGIFRDLPAPLRGLVRLFAISPTRGARTPVYLASSPEVEGVSGHYFLHCRPARASTTSYDGESAQRLWRLTAQLLRLPEAQAPPADAGGGTPTTRGVHQTHAGRR
ncbi:MAG: SDR family oxidoreductase [Gammaproteobacteria bacterium]|nr:SDR family oxidoreductase [Gammaproteobacteria bacterium]NIR83419.1 SDR family oxidoreductase [Gammaproteobacteria bacterium]NIR91341.1 SDR family oxidoreductase [Gammaproteobacteria bacterium]NIU04581.1 SDR family oxidoreductase [Gammaproteobacteria bacterium]NIV51623.1 SDR family NAD(P)-dependent oxidoreductase [Gammaproteobacteria bacterium]